jgi:choloylglycine hydrolase
VAFFICAQACQCLHNEFALVESNYGKPAEGAKVISLSTWPQYVLDNFATVAEAVADRQQDEFRVQTVALGNARPANMHLVISDASGDSAVFEYVEGKLVMHHGKQYKVVTNSPTYDKQLAIWSTGRTPATFWVKLDDLDLSDVAPAK